LYWETIFDKKFAFVNRGAMKRLHLLIIIGCFGLAVSASAFARDTEPAGVQFDRVANGISLYEAYCADCHKSFAKTTKPQRSVSRLRSSIQHFSEMSNLDFLNNEQLDAIASALSTIPLKAASFKK
jgi:mono/diheme cytochrome c family protein